jgi:Tol biopolymer transport system component
MHRLITRTVSLAGAASIALLGVVPAQAHPSQEPRIAFGRFDPGIGDLTLWTVRPDGTGERRVTKGPALVSDWSPDRSRLLYDFPDRHGNQQVAVIGAHGRWSKQLTRRPGISECAEFTPDGRRIVFNRSPLMPDDPAFFTSLWIMNADGSHQRPLFKPDPAKFDVEPSVSPDGRRVAFNRLGIVDGEFAGSVHVVDIDGTGERQVTPMTVGLEHPQWSPDGKRIAYEIDSLSDVPHPPNGIWTSTLRGHQRLVLPSTDERVYLKPQFSPAGGRVVVLCYDVATDQADVCVVRADGRRVRNITDSPDEHENIPVW